MVSLKPPPRSGDGTNFIDQFGSTFGTKDVTVTPGTERPERPVATYPAVITAKSAQFNVDTPIYEGDGLEWDDPRGGRMRRFAAQVDVNDAGGAAASLAHVRVELATTGTTAPQKRVPRVDGHVIVVNGSNVNIALEGATITQQIPVSAGYEALADAVGKALAVIERTEGIDPDEIEFAREAATQVVEEAAKAEPDKAVIKKALPMLRGVLSAAATSGAGKAASELVAQLFT
ncbi:hypothetical protein ASD13_02375 [Microbacterium sp. Root1433D1]|uniref:hypothetical protein n=1 Tax=Microbacterium sp. Root1433D1 TaxID=1736463 RepID=UPI0006F951AF|nr:hypothetical protein [Microbacterium sp. Root1433D1]KQY77545.1 hypothetical protein ASD13_02375 [Microbacterium sp. Root1433D1]